ncbi:erg24, C-14 sterol reductase [Entomortierella beljakovae]|nr:erg24, C-14 sterol reductase [Entomortierella beljakovae]
MPPKKAASKAKPASTSSSVADTKSSSTATTTTTTTHKSSTTTHKSKPEYEFLGPPGAFGMVTVLPLITYALYFNCRPGFGCIPAYWDSKDGFWPPVNTDYQSWDYQSWPSSFINFFKSNWDQDAFDAYSAFIAFLFVAYFLVPGKVVEGAPVGGVGGSTLIKDRANYRLKYKVNALRTMGLIAAFVAGTVYTKGVTPFLFLHDKFVELITASLAWTFGISLFVYIWSFLPDEMGQPKILSSGGSTGNMLYDFVMGRELNPRLSYSNLATFDIKYFIELRPGLIGWILLNFGMACKQYHDLGRLTNSMVVVQILEAFYVVDSLWNESAVLTTMDITTDGFGFMLANGLLTWLPMNYSIQARFLASYPVDMTPLHFFLVIATQCIGYYIFRGANAQKNNFRSFGADAPINKGLASPLPYFYPIYFAVLLIHRSLRDEEKCRKKYGKDWDKYCEIVRWRIIPYIY